MSHDLNMASAPPSMEPDDIVLYAPAWSDPWATDGQPAFDVPDGYEPASPPWIAMRYRESQMWCWLWARVYRPTLEERQRRRYEADELARREARERARLAEIAACEWLRQHGVPVESFEALHGLYQRDLLQHCRNIGAPRHNERKATLIRAIIDRAITAVEDASR